MIDMNAPEIKFSLHAVRQAALVVRGVQEELVSPALTKSDLSPVTVADFASQAIIGRLLSAAFPQDRLVAEEESTILRDPAQGPTLALVTQFVQRFTPPATTDAVCDWIDFGRADTSPRFWALDPIDGTKGFLRGDQFVVALALVEDGQVQIGILGCPNLADGFRTDPYGEGSLVIAVRGQGTWATSLVEPKHFERLHVSVRSDPGGARILRSYESGHTNVGQIDLFARALGVEAEPVLMDSQAKYAVMASGKGDLLLRLLSPGKPGYREKIWDQAAGSLVLEEAGGKITDLQGRPLDFTTGRSLTNNRGILATNGLLHAAALEALEKIGALEF